MRVGAECTSCGQCFEVCESGAITFAGRGYKQSVIDERICINCGACKEVCPAEAIHENS